jgi:peptidoglycan hydrolase-like protein with peptidoglycan-binding domain
VSPAAALGAPSTGQYVGPAGKAAAEWWLGTIPPGEFRVNTGDQGSFTGVHGAVGSFTDHTTLIVPPRVRGITGARVTSSAKQQSGAIHGSAVAGDLAILVACHRTPVSATGPGWTTEDTVTGTDDSDRWGWGVVAWRILSAGDIAAGTVVWDTGGADTTGGTVYGSWALVVVESGTFDLDDPISGVDTYRYSNDTYAATTLAVDMATWVENTLGLWVSAHQGSSAASFIPDYGDGVEEFESSPTGSVVWVTSPATDGPAPGGNSGTFYYATPGVVTSAVTASVLVTPATVALGCLSAGAILSFTTVRYQDLNITSDDALFTDEVDASEAPVDAVAGDQAVRYTYTAEDDGDLVVTAEEPGSGFVVDLYVLDSTGAVLSSSSTGTITQAVTADATYTVVVAPVYPPAGVRITAVGPRHATALPSTWPASAAPAVPALTPYTDAPLLQRRSPTVPAPSLTDGRPVAWAATAWTETDWGTFRVIVDGTDVTRFRDVPCVIDRYQLMEPFGCGPAQVTFPQIGPWEARSGSLAWLAIGHDVDIVRLHANGSSTTVLWSGLIPSEGIKAGPGGRSVTLTLIGDIWAADLQIHKPPPYLPATDLGTVIARAFNKEVISRRIAKVTNVATGVDCRKRGSSDQSVLQYVQELLGVYGTTEDGTGCWTVARTGTPRTYEIRLKALAAAASITIRPGAYWDTELILDATETPNAVYGSGVNPTGYAWAGWVYPKASTDTYKAYPLPTSPLEVMTTGTVDADTLTGTGVSDLQERLNDLNIRGVAVTVDGVYSAADASDVRVVQSHYGLLIDGIVGPQTWAACFPQYLTDTLDGAFRLPLAIKSAVKPRNYYPDGTDAGANPGYDPDTLRVEVDRQYEAGITKAEARRSAAAELLRAPTPGLTGTITLPVDPPEMSRWDITEGMRVSVPGVRGATKTLHVVGVEARPPNSATDTGTVVLTVDEYARDLLTVAGILARDAETREDPVRLPARKLRRSKVTADSVVPFDGESCGGIIRRTALIGGLWVYVDVPVSQSGRVAKVELTTTPAAKFTVAFFGDVTVTPAQMIKYVGPNPLAETKSGYGPYDRLPGSYPALGFIQGIGGPGQAAGYDPGYEDSPYSPGTSTTLTGKLRSAASWEYASNRPPFLRVFFWSPTDCSIVGRLWPAPMEG